MAAVRQAERASCRLVDLELTERRSGCESRVAGVAWLPVWRTAEARADIGLRLPAHGAIYRRDEWAAALGKRLLAVHASDLEALMRQSTTGAPSRRNPRHGRRARQRASSAQPASSTAAPPPTATWRHGQRQSSDLQTPPAAQHTGRAMLLLECLILLAGGLKVLDDCRPHLFGGPVAEKSLC